MSNADSYWLLQSFLVAQSLFALFPVLFFASFVLGVLCVALVSAALFSIFWIGLAAVVLGSTLFVTTGAAILMWVWVVGWYLGASFIYGLVVPKEEDGDKKLQRKREQIVVKKEDVNGEKQSHNEEAAGGEKRNGINGTDEAHDHDHPTVPSSPSER